MSSDWGSTFRAVTMTEEEPLLVKKLDTESLTHHDIEVAKGKLIDDHLDIGPDGPELKGDDERPVPYLRTFYCFKVCVARNPKTPINELHLIQPLLLLCVILGCILLLIGPMLQSSSMSQSAGAALVLLVFSSVALFVVGRVARAIPSLEDQVITLINDDKIVEKGKNKEVDMAEEAEDLQALTLQLVNQTAEQRSMVKNMHKAFIDKEKDFIRLRYKAKMMGLFWNAEQDLYLKLLRKRQHDLRTGRLTPPIKPIPPPNGALTIDELRGVVGNLRDRGDDIEILDDLLEKVIKKRLEPQLTPEDLNSSFASQREWSYSQLIDLIIEEARRFGKKDPASKAILDELGLIEDAGATKVRREKKKIKKIERKLEQT